LRFCNSAFVRNVDLLLHEAKRRLSVLDRIAHRSKSIVTY